MSLWEFEAGTAHDPLFLYVSLLQRGRELVGGHRSTISEWPHWSSHATNIEVQDREDQEDLPLVCSRAGSCQWLLNTQPTAGSQRRALLAWWVPSDSCRARDLSYHDSSSGAKEILEVSRWQWPSCPGMTSFVVLSSWSQSPGGNSSTPLTENWKHWHLPKVRKWPMATLHSCKVTHCMGAPWLTKCCHKDMCLAATYSEVLRGTLGARSQGATVCICQATAQWLKARQPVVWQNHSYYSPYMLMW